MSGKRGKNWSSEEDMFLVRSIVHASHDARSGADQKAKEFWDKVLKQFEMFIPGTQGTTCSIQNRWKKELQPSISKFVGHFTTIWALERSGWKEDDYVTEAVKLYNEIESKGFENILLWEYLREKEPKFQDSILCGMKPSATNRTKRCRPEATAIPEIEDMLVDEEDKQRLDRPGGAKKSKELGAVTEQRLKHQESLRNTAE
jgi:hypothetical protein